VKETLIRLLISDKTEEKATTLLWSYLILDSIRLIAFTISSMFIVLFLLDSLESTEVGFLFALSYFILTVIDYPTGVLGDVIGHQKVLILAYIFHIISFILLIISETFLPLLLYSGISAFASSQESGALEAWFDNNYRRLMNAKDPKREIYNSFQARKSILTYSLFGFSILIGGFIAYLFSRKILFLVSLFFIIIVFFLIIALVIDEKNSKVEITLKNYFDQFSNGIKVLLSHYGIFLFFIGSTIIWAANNSIWVNFLLFRIYEGYSGGQDNTTALLRALIFTSGVLWQFLIIRYITRLKRNKLWIFITTSFSNPIFFLGMYVYYLWFPPTEVSVFLIIGLILMFQMPSIFEPLEGILRNQLNLDLIPDRSRNSFYSLLPTLTNLIGIFGALIAGFFLSNYGFVETILLTAIISGLGVILTGLGLFWLPQIQNAINQESNRE